MSEVGKDMAGFKKNLVAFLSAVLMMSSFEMAPTFAMDADLEMTTIKWALIRN
ncbi:hypothetical protein [Erysipelothrix piscisicarius]|uniref:hypothetical protein n=1 Tax=Erysipelothrix piscisicarius TaxID=2485784 RepID=UPI001E5820C7|nr:hypothetical protein [Erysipelothrix piscisicarius]